MVRSENKILPRNNYPHHGDQRWTAQFENTHSFVNVLLANILGRELGLFLRQYWKEFKVKNKVDYVITDNASNMKSAFTATFPHSTEDADDDTLPDESESTAIPLDGETMWLPFEEQKQ